MKRIFLFIVVLPFTISCVSTPAENTQPEYQKIIEVEDMSSEDLFTKTQLWASDTFVSAEDAIELVNQDTGIITIRTSYKSEAYKLGAAFGGTYYTTYKIVIEIREGRSRISCKSPIYEVISGYERKEMSVVQQEQVDEYSAYANAVIALYEDYLVSEEDDW